MAESPDAETPLADLTDAPSGLVLDVYLLAPDVLLYHLGVLHHVLADAHLFLGHGALLHHDLFLGQGHPHLVLADLGLRGFARERNPLHRDLLVARGHLYALAVGPDALANADLAGFALAGSCGELLLAASRSRVTAATAASSTSVRRTLSAAAHSVIPRSEERRVG